MKDNIKLILMSLMLAVSIYCCWHVVRGLDARYVTHAELQGMKYQFNRIETKYGKIKELMMKEIIFKGAVGTIDISKVDNDTPVFAKKKGDIVGMVVKEEAGWILRLGGEYGFSGHHETRLKCMESASAYTFFIELTGI